MTVKLDLQRSDAKNQIDLCVYNDLDNKILTKMGYASQKTSIEVDRAAKLKFEDIFRSTVGTTYVNVEDLLKGTRNSSEEDERPNLSVEIAAGVLSGPRVSDLSSGKFYEGDAVTPCFNCCIL